MHVASTTTMWLQAMMHAAVYGPSVTVPMQYVCTMDLLALSGRSAPAAAVRKAVGIWAARRTFRVCIDGCFAALLGTVGSSNQIQ